MFTLRVATSGIHSRLRPLGRTLALRHLEATLSAVNAASKNSPLSTAAIARIPMGVRVKVSTEFVNEPVVFAIHVQQVGLVGMGACDSWPRGHVIFTHSHACRLMNGIRGRMKEKVGLALPGCAWWLAGGEHDNPPRGALARTCQVSPATRS